MQTKPPAEKTKLWRIPHLNNIELLVLKDLDRFTISLSAICSHRWLVILSREHAVMPRMALTPQPVLPNFGRGGARSEAEGGAQAEGFEGGTL
jgi:hypothetical protein